LIPILRSTDIYVEPDFGEIKPLDYVVAKDISMSAKKEGEIQASKQDMGGKIHM